MRYTVDFEFDGHNGPLLSMALVGENDYSCYTTCCYDYINDPWVRENVEPYLDLVVGEVDLTMQLDWLPEWQVGYHLREFLSHDTSPITVIADSPVDIGRFCQVLSTDPYGNWQSTNFEQLSFEVHNVNCWPNSLEGAIQHNAYWDARALWEKLRETGK